MREIIEALKTTIVCRDKHSNEIMEIKMVEPVMFYVNPQNKSYHNASPRAMTMKFIKENYEIL